MAEISCYLLFYLMHEKLRNPVSEPHGSSLPVVVHTLQTLRNDTELWSEFSNIIFFQRTLK